MLKVGLQRRAKQINVKANMFSKHIQELCAVEVIDINIIIVCVYRSSSGNLGLLLIKFYELLLYLDKAKKVFYVWCF